MSIKNLTALPGQTLPFAMDPLTAGLIIGGGAIAGGIAGAIPKKESSVQRIELGEASEFERTAGRLSQQQLDQLQALVGQGPGASDVSAGVESTRDLATLLEQLQATGGLPGQEDIAVSQQFASDIFGAQRQAQQTAFRGQEERTAQLAAQLGRPVNDPILQARLARSQTEQAGQLAAQQGAFGAAQAQALPLQRLQFAGQLADVRGGLASQALSNRQTLLALGSQLQQSERQFRLAQATTTRETRGGGGFGGAIGGALAGAGGGLGFVGRFGAGGSQGGGGGRNIAEEETLRAFGGLQGGTPSQLQSFQTGGPGAARVFGAAQRAV